MCVCALNHRIEKPWGKPREKGTPTRRLSRDRTRWSGIRGWLYGLVRTSALGRVVDLSLNPEASRGEGGRLPRAPAHAIGKYVIGFISILILSISYINTYFNKYLRKYYIILILFLNILSFSFGSFLFLSFIYFLSLSFLIFLISFLILKYLFSRIRII